MDVPGIGHLVWSGAFNTTLMRCTAETVTLDGAVEVLRIGEGHLRVSGTDRKNDVRYPLRSIRYEGSTLSFVKVRELHEALGALKHVAANLRSLGLLSPQSMRRRTKDATDIGYGGERLGAYIHGLPPAARMQLAQASRQFYPQVSELATKALRAGWKDLHVVEQYGSAKSGSAGLESNTRQMNDGLLRVLAVLSQVSVSDPAGIGQSCVLFDEIENGINPELVHKLVDLLLHARRRVIVTTHSPLVLNCLPDAVAKESVLLLFRNAAGHAQVIRLFDLPSTRRKLEMLGPGEVFVDTQLEALPAEALALQDTPAPQYHG